MAGARYPRAARIRKPAEFVAMRRKGRRAGGQFFNAQFAPADGEGARLGLAVSRRVSTRAVRRNRIKRIARESFRRRRAKLPPVDILLIARETADAQTSEVLRADLEAIWRRVAALNERGRPGTMRA